MGRPCDSGAAPAIIRQPARWSALICDTNATRLLDAPDRVDEIVVALPRLQKLHRGGQGDILIELHDLADFAAARRRLVRARLAAQQEDRVEDRRRHAEAAA